MAASGRTLFGCRLRDDRLAPRIRWNLSRCNGCRAAILSSTLLLAPRIASATAETCMQLHASGQREAKAGRLRLASELFASCGSSDSCPHPVRSECVELYGAVEKAIPTIVFSVTDDEGQDITNVKVYSTDQLLVEKLDGRPVRLDPGKHRFRFVLPWGEVLSSDALVREGEKNRVVAVRQAAKPQKKPEPLPAVPAPDPNPPAPPRPPEPEPEPEPDHALPVEFWIASGVGVTALASWGVFALAGQGKQTTLEACSPACAESLRDDYDAMRRDYLIADVSLGLAAASFGVATWFFFSEQGSNSPSGLRGSRKRSPSLALAPLVTTQGASVVLRASSF